MFSLMFNIGQQKAAEESDRNSVFQSSKTQVKFFGTADFQTSKEEKLCLAALKNAQTKFLPVLFSCSLPETSNTGLHLPIRCHPTGLVCDVIILGLDIEW